MRKKQILTPVPKLPEPVLIKIFSYLNIYDRFQASQVCSAWYSAAVDPSFNDFFVLKFRQLALTNFMPPIPQLLLSRRRFIKLSLIDSIIGFGMEGFWRNKCTSLKSLIYNAKPPDEWISILKYATGLNRFVLHQNVEKESIAAYYACGLQFSSVITVQVVGGFASNSVFLSFLSLFPNVTCLDLRFTRLQEEDDVFDGFNYGNVMRMAKCSQLQALLLPHRAFENAENVLQADEAKQFADIEQNLVAFSAFVDEKSSDIVLKALERQKRLSVLILSFNDVKFFRSNHLESMENLTMLTLNDPPTFQDLSFLNQFKKLKHLMLTGITFYADTTHFGLETNLNLQHLEISWKNHSKMLVSDISKAFPSLQTLKCNTLNQEDLICICNGLNALNSLEIDATNLTEYDFLGQKSAMQSNKKRTSTAILNELRALEELICTNMRFTDILTVLFKLPKLRVFRASSITVDGLEELVKNCVYLEELCVGVVDGRGRMRDVTRAIHHLKNLRKIRVVVSDEKFSQKMIKNFIMDKFLLREVYLGAVDCPEALFSVFPMLKAIGEDEDHAVWKSF